MSSLSENSMSSLKIEDFALMPKCRPVTAVPWEVCKKCPYAMKLHPGIRKGKMGEWEASITFCILDCIKNGIPLEYNEEADGYRFVGASP